MTAVPKIHDDRRLPALTGLRFLAALAVVVSHFSERGVIPGVPAIVDFLDGGRTAVALFFVLSGFVLFYNYAAIGGPGSRRAFYEARIARIYPTVLLALAVGAIGVANACASRDQNLLAERFGVNQHVVFFLVASFFAQLASLTGWLPSASLNQPWNGPAWSISCEFFFYALFPLLAVWLRDKKARFLAVVVLAAFVGQAVFVFALAPLTPLGQRGFLVYQFPVPHLVEFLCGIVAAIYYQRRTRHRAAGSRGRSLLLLCSLVPIVVLSLIHPLDPAYILMTPFFALLVLALALPAKRGRSWLTWAPLLLLGESSFALYLLHIPLLNVVTIWPVPRAIGWLIMASFVAVSVVVFRWYETPARRIVRRWLSATRSRREGRGPLALSRSRGVLPPGP